MADRAEHRTKPLDLLELNTSRSLLARLTMNRLWAGADTKVLFQADEFKRQAVRYLTDVERGSGTGPQGQLRTALYRLREGWQALSRRSSPPRRTPAGPYRRSQRRG